MTTELNALLPFILIGLVVLVVTVWLIAKANRKTTVIDDGSIRQDVLDEGAERARRNQALIDAAPAAQITPPPMAGTMAGLGETIAVAAQDEVEELEPELKESLKKIGVSSVSDIENLEARNIDLAKVAPTGTTNAGISDLAARLKSRRAA